jgi:hypothetical protein
VLDANLPFFVKVDFTVPAVLAQYLDGTFRIRAFAESIGNGPERQIGSDLIVPAASGQTNYPGNLINVPGNTLPGEGASDADGRPVSGVYRIVTVLQYVNQFGVATEGSGFAEGPTIQLRQP